MILDPLITPYTPDGKLARCTWARGIVTDYTYDNAGLLVSTTYSADTDHNGLFGIDPEKCKLYGTFWGLSPQNFRLCKAIRFRVKK